MKCDTSQIYRQHRDIHRYYTTVAKMFVFNQTDSGLDVSIYHAMRVLHKLNKNRKLYGIRDKGYGIRDRGYGIRDAV